MEDFGNLIGPSPVGIFGGPMKFDLSIVNWRNFTVPFGFTTKTQRAQRKRVTEVF